MSTTITSNPLALATHLDDQVQNVVMIDGKEVDVEVANTHSPARRVPKVTFRCAEYQSAFKDGPVHYAKIFLPKTYEDAKVAATRLFLGVLKTHSTWVLGEEKQVPQFVLKVSIRRYDEQGFVWAGILDDEWWTIMNELIDENPNLEVVVIPLE